MLSIQRITLIVAAAGAALGGCDQDAAVVDNAAPVDDEVTFRVVADNGEELNGPLLNGLRMNGLRMNGLRMNGLRMNGLRMNGTDLENFSFGSNSLVRALVDAITKVGAELEGSEFDMDYDDGGGPVAKRLKINRVTQSSVDPDIYFNEILYLQSEPNTWDYLCRDGAGNPTEAIGLNFVWDDATGARNELSDALTWACRGAALAKVVEWGYAPWRLHGGTTSLKDYHQAAVRMIRADYCGTGVTHTVNGNPIDVSDALGIQEPGTSWPVEAKWGPSGAVCLNTPRRQAWSRAAVIAECEAAGKGTLPYCTDNDPSEHGGMLMTQANAL